MVTKEEGLPGRRQGNSQTKRSDLITEMDGSDLITEMDGAGHLLTFYTH